MILSRDVARISTTTSAVGSEDSATVKVVLTTSWTLSTSGTHTKPRSSSSLIVSRTAGGSAGVPCEFVAVPVTSTCLSGASTRFGTAATVTRPSLEVSS